MADLQPGVNQDMGFGGMSLGGGSRRSAVGGMILTLGMKDDIKNPRRLSFWKGILPRARSKKFAPWLGSELVCIAAFKRLIETIV